MICQYYMLTLFVYYAHSFSLFLVHICFADADMQELQKQRQEIMEAEQQKRQVVG